MSDINTEKTPDSTFDRLRDLQILLKKESALKELCKNKQLLIKILLFSYQNKRRNKKSNKSRMCRNLCKKIRST